MGLKELLAKLINDYKTIQTAHPEGMPEAEFEQAKGILDKIKNTKAQIEMGDQLKAHEDFATKPAAAPSAASAGWQADDAKADAGPAYDGKSWRETKVTTVGGVKTLRYHVPLVVQKKEYIEAFDRYVRTKGNMDLLSGVEKKALNEGVDIDGGFLVPPDYIERIIQKTAAATVIRPLATVINTGRDVVQIPRINYTTDDIYTSAVRASWVGEVPASGDHRADNIVFGNFDIPVNKLMGSMLVSNDLIMDSSFDVLGLVADKLGEAFALEEDNQFINGDGIKKPMGILTNVDAATGPVSVISGSNSALTADKIITLYYAVPAQYRMLGKFIMSSSTMSAVEILKDAENRYIISSLINGASLAAMQFDHIKGKPVLADEFMPTIAQNAYPVIFGDLSGYTIVDRVGISIVINTTNNVDTDQTLIVGKKRVGGQLTEPYRMKVQKISAT